MYNKDLKVLENMVIIRGEDLGTSCYGSLQEVVIEGDSNKYIDRIVKH